MSVQIEVVEDWLHRTVCNCSWLVSWQKTFKKPSPYPVGKKAEKKIVLKHFSMKNHRVLHNTVFLFQNSLVHSFFLGWKSQSLKNTSGIIQELLECFSGNFASSLSSNTETIKLAWNFTSLIRVLYTEMLLELAQSHTLMEKNCRMKSFYLKAKNNTAEAWLAILY